MVKSLTSDYRRELTIPIEYINVPPDVNLAAELPDTLLISLSGTGWKFLSGNLFESLQSLTVDLSFLSRQPAGIITYPSSRFVNRIPELKSTEVKILRIEPDTLRFLLAENSSVKVPVVADVSISCKNQFMVSGEIKIIPDSIEIFGNLQTLSSISSVTAVPLKLDLISNTVDTTVSFSLPQGVRSSLKGQQVRLIIPVSEFAEKQFTVPVRPSPSMAGRFKFYPDKANLTVRAPVSKIKSFNAADFSVIAEMHSPSARYSRLICDKLPVGVELFLLTPPFAETYIQN